jgi:Pentapeptide repeats (8 copies)
VVTDRWRSVGVFVVGVAGFLLIAYVVLKLAPDWFAETKDLNAKGRTDERQGVRTASLALLAGAIAVIGAVYTARTFALNRAGQLTDRFTKAIEQLGHKELDVRLGGIYALERIARDSREDHPQVVEVLTAYVREHAPQQDDPPVEPGAPRDPEDRLPRMAYNPWRGPSTHPATDVQAVLTVLARRTLAHEDATTLDLSSTELQGANLRGGGSFRGVDLSEADPSEADMRHADLSKADLSQATLTRTSLDGANLSGADLSRAELENAYLSGANLSGANLGWASLRGADLIDADLGGADLSGAHLGWTDLSAADLRGTTYNGHTTWPTDFDQEAAGAKSTASE